jgi:hypothetical protein
MKIKGNLTLLITYKIMIWWGFRPIDTHPERSFVAVAVQQ